MRLPATVIDEEKDFSFLIKVKGSVKGKRKKYKGLYNSIKKPKHKKHLSLGSNNDFKKKRKKLVVSIKEIQDDDERDSSQN